MRYVLMHVSDLHAGPPFDQEVAALLAQDARKLAPDLLVVSGDFVQRADFVAQWERIKAYLATLPEPRLMVPGNHDVPLYNPFNRIFRSLDHYRRHISPEINQVFERPGLMVVGGNSAHGLTVDGGRVNREQLATMARLFGRASDDVCKIAVLHHHVINPAGSHRTKIANAGAVVEMLDRCGVELLLCGHIHVSYVGTTRDVEPALDRGTIICQSGTSTSRRGKGRERHRNSYNVIEIADDAIRIQQRLYRAEAGQFVVAGEYVFPRGAR